MVTDFTYDEMNRVTSETFPASPSEDIQYTYDTGTGTNVSGRLASFSDESGITTFSYDARGNVTTRERTNSGQAFLTSFDYDLADNLVAITYPSGRHVSYIRDSTTGKVSDVDSVLIPQPLSLIASNFTYASRGPVTSWTSGSGDFHNRTLDQDYRITGIGVGFGLYDVGYNYDVVNNVLDWNDYLDYTKTQNFTYDNLDRLDFVFGPTSTYGSYGYHSYQYDQNGNRIDDSKSSVYRQHTIDLSSNRMTSIGTDPIGYDAVGNKVSDHAGTRVFTYNQRNRLSTVVDNGVNVGSYVYNALGQRSQKTTPTSSIDFVYDLEGKLIGEYDNGVIVREYIYAHGMPIAQADATDVLFLHPDHLGTPRVATDNLGTVVWRWDSTAFGEGAPDEDPDGDSILVTINLRFPGQYFDAETGEDYNYFRTYDPTIGRYTQSDPIGLQGGLNTYAYAYDDPVNLTDRYGLYPAESDAYCDPRWPECSPAKDAPYWANSEFQNCYTQCQAQRYFICAPWSIAGRGVGRGVAALSGSGALALEGAGYVGGALGGQACRALAFDQSCVEQCKAEVDQCAIE